MEQWPELRCLQANYDVHVHRHITMCNDVRHRLRVHQVQDGIQLHPGYWHRPNTVAIVAACIPEGDFPTATYVLHRMGP